MYNRPDPMSTRDDIERENARRRDEAGQRRQSQAAFRKARKAHSRNNPAALAAV